VKKARSLGNQAEYPVLADDSGLSIPALNGEPGIFSARYGSEETGRNLEAGERNAYLLEKMKGVKNRQGFFVCAMVLYLSPYRFFIAQETMDGIITESPRGEGGFGYDPVFFLPEYGQTVAELPWELKNQISHRGKAGARIRSILKELKEHQ
jgi:XTP/dITP diphosphohydrolase